MRSATYTTASFFLNKFATFYLLYILDHSSIGLHTIKVRNGVNIAMDNLIYNHQEKRVCTLFIYFFSLFLRQFEIDHLRSM